MARQPMSMEAMLDQERREVLALLEDRPSQPARSSSPFTPQSPVRSMLDIGGADVPSSSSAARAAVGAGPKSPTRTAPVRSMLDIDSPPTPVRSMLDIGGPLPKVTKQTSASAATSPTEPHHQAPPASKAAVHNRSMSDAANKPVEFGPRSSQTRIDPSFTSDYQFSDIITSQQGPLLPKRVMHGGKRGGGVPSPSAMAEALRGVDVSSLILPGNRGRHYSSGAPGIGSGSKSKSPHNRLAMRSNSPHVALPDRHLSPAGRTILDDQSLDMHNAYRRLSDANLARSGGSLSELSRRKRSDDSAAGGRLRKDYISPDGDVLPEDSSDDDGHSSSDDEGERGRKTARSFPEDGRKLKSPAGIEPGKDANRKALSLLAAAEEERIQVAASQPAYQYRSLLDEPEITITSPSGEKVKQSKSGVHPATSFDEPSRSASRTPLDSDEEEDYTDIRRAQKLSFSMTPIMSTPNTHRSIRIIYRGDYAKVQQEADEEHRRLRKYIVATDLSDESTHALEWAVGTVLRDGDTLIALYCVDEETGIVTGDNVLVPDEPKAMKEQAVALHAMTSSKAPMIADAPSYRPSPLRTADSVRASPSPAPSNERSKAEEERSRAVQSITDRITRLLRKTRLQVRVIVEVLHCKNPKHLIIEVIDVINPTLVILGSRGRSALKGVILGSFSNYLVTKSSVPVMVARKRLRKQSKYKRPPVQQVNNLTNPTARSLANAKID